MRSWSVIRERAYGRVSFPRMEGFVGFEVGQAGVFFYGLRARRL